MLINSPVGSLGFDGDQEGITAMHWSREGSLPDGGVADQIAYEIEQYFEGTLKRFSVPLHIRGSDFQRRFLKALIAIPYGETRTYGELAIELGVSAQAIGQACGANPIAILIPCHRVLAADGLGGYSGEGGIETKVTLLKLEGAAGILI